MRKSICSLRACRGYFTTILWGKNGRRRTYDRDTPPHAKLTFLQSWISRKKSGPIPDECRRENGWAIAELSTLRMRLMRVFWFTIAGVESSGWSLGLHPGGVVVDFAVAVPPSLRQAVHRLSALSLCLASGLSSSRCWEKARDIWGLSIPIARLWSRGDVHCLRPTARKGQAAAGGLAPRTVWRWLSWLGGMPGTLRVAMGLIQDKEPNAALHQELWTVPAWKYRSQRRRDTLQQAMQLLAADRVCAKLFGKGIFPAMR